MSFVKDGEFNKDRIVNSVKLSETLNLSVSPSGQFRVNSYDIPYSEQTWLFQTFGYKRESFTKFLFGQDVVKYREYVLDTGKDEYSCELTYASDKSEPIVIFNKNGRTHCDSGPAHTSEGCQRWYKDGDLHNENGPALVREGHKPIFALNGNVYDQAGYILNHPGPKKHSLWGEATMTHLPQYPDGVVLENGQHTLLLKQCKERKPENFLLSVLSDGIPNLSIEEYHPPNQSLHRLYHELKNYTMFGMDDSGDEKTFIGVHGLDGINITFEHAQGRLEIRRYSYDTVDGLVANEKEIEVIKLFPERELLNQPKNKINLVKHNEILEDGHKQKAKKVIKTIRRRKSDKAYDEILKAKWSTGGWTDEDLKSKFKTKFSNELDRFIDGSVPDILDHSAKVYGISVPWDIYIRCHYSGEDNSYYWVDEDGEFDSPAENFPAIIFPNGKMLFFKNGFLHNSSGPAIQGVYERQNDEWYLWGERVSQSEVAKIHSETSADQSVNKKMGVSVANPSKYSELKPDEVEDLKKIFRENLPHLRKYEADIRRAAKKALENKGFKVEEIEEKRAPEITRKEPARIEVTKKVRTKIEESSTRSGQLVNGFKFGFKKGIVNNSSHLLAEKVASLTPFEKNEWFERFLQVCFLLGAAEAMEKMPEGMATKLRLDENQRLDAASMCRYISGENLGRDLVDIAENLLPLILEVVQNMTAEDLEDLSHDFEEEQSEDSSVEGENLFQGIAEDVEEVQTKKQYEEVMA